MARIDRNRLTGTPQTYRPGHEFGCPGCGRTNWHVGRSTAECAYCATAVPLSADTGHWVDIRRAA